MAVPKAKKPKKKEMDRPTKTPLHFIRTANYVTLAIILRVLWTVYGWRHKRIAYFLEAYLSLLEEGRKFGYKKVISETKELTGVDVVELIDGIFVDEK